MDHLIRFQLEQFNTFAILSLFRQYHGRGPPTAPPKEKKGVFTLHLGLHVALPTIRVLLSRVQLEQHHIQVELKVHECHLSSKEEFVETFEFDLIRLENNAEPYRCQKLDSNSNTSLNNAKLVLVISCVCT